MRGSDYAARYIALRQRRSEFAQAHYDQNEKEIKTCNESMEHNAMLLRSTLEFPNGGREAIYGTIKELQRKKAELLLERRYFDRKVYGRLPTPGELRKEFYDIRNVPTVYTARVLGRVVYVELAARLEIGGVRYNLGDWQLMLDLSADTINTRQLRSGLTKEIQRVEQFRHGQYNWDFGFCFGENLDLVEQLVRESDYVTAVRTAAAYMNDVNPEHRGAIDRYYRKVQGRASNSLQ